MADAGSDVPNFSVEFRDNFAILWMDNLENRFTTPSVKYLNILLDKIESNDNVKFLVTIGKGKFFSNGLDLDTLVEYSQSEIKNFNDLIGSLFMRILTFPVPTIAALNGHAYAGGGILALCHDYRIMRTKRGWFCLPEVNLRLRFSPLMISIVKAKILDPKVRVDVIIMGKKYTAEEALGAKLVDKVCDDSELLDTAVDYGRSVVGFNNWDRKHMADLKNDLYWEVTDHIDRMFAPLRGPLKDILSKL